MTVSKQDIEAKARQLVSVVDDTKESAKDKAMIGVVGVAVLIGAAFLFGRKRGSRNKTMVEVYRV
ncbi:MAG: hypothetical protein KY394_04375 [Actinobacteria bacterium]|nr:hypothetical protein [Actinomycetota bacterium]